MNPTGKQFCSYLSQGEGDLPGGSPWKPGLALLRWPPEQCLWPEPTHIPHTGCAQGAHPTWSHRHAGPMEQLLGLLNLVSFAGFFVFFELFDVII